MTDLLVPIGPKLPLSVEGKFHSCGHPTAITEAMPRNHRPKKPVMLYLPDGSALIIAGMGEAEAAEIEDIAYTQMDKKPFDFEDARERAGYARSEDFDTFFREGLDRSIAYKKRNQRTDPRIKEHKKRQWQGGIDAKNVD
jgi:hypothetical protein